MFITKQHHSHCVFYQKAFAFTKSLLPASYILRNAHKEISSTKPHIFAKRHNRCILKYAATFPPRQLQLDYNLNNLSLLDKYRTFNYIRYFIILHKLFAHIPMTKELTNDQKELLAYAARLITEEGFDYGAAKKKAQRDLGLPARIRLPDNDALEEAVKEHITLFCADTQPQELQMLRKIALQWMQKMQDFAPFISGAVWHGTATKQSDIYLQLFCDDEKMPEIFLINNRIRYTSSTQTRPDQRTIPVITAEHPVAQWGLSVLIHMAIYDHDDIRGALVSDTQGRSPRGNIAALQHLLD